MKTNKAMAIPRLRFPEFKSEGDWEDKKIKELLDYEQPTKYLVNNTNYISEGIPVLTANKSFVLGYTNEKDGIYESVPVIIFDDFTTDSKYVDFPFKVKSSAIKILTGKENSDIRFSHALFNNIKFDASQHKRYYISTYQNITVKVPSLPEQQKIADCLSSLDTLIKAESEQLDALKSHKAGLLQQLFPADGETVPKLRFGEFEGDGDWKVSPLGELCNVLMCKRIFANQTNDLQGIPFYKIGTLGSSPDAFISRDLYEDYKNKYNFPRKGEVLLTCSGTVGKTIAYDGEDAYYQDSNIVWLDNPKENIRNEFLYYIISKVNWGLLNSNTITRIYGADLRSLKVQFPIKISEQQKITDCISSLDDLIQSKEDKIEVLKRHKQGLMQQLFPSSEKPS